jgi:hypothetical protein
VLAHEARAVALPAGHPLVGRDYVMFAVPREEGFITNPIVDGVGAPIGWLDEPRRHRLPGRVAAEAASLQRS